MKNRLNTLDFQHKTTGYTYIPAITTIAMPLLFGKRKNPQTTTESLKEKPLKPEPKPKSTVVSKYELTDNTVKFYDAKGFPKKRWVLLKEIPIREITSIESFGNELSINWNDSHYLFVFKKKTESFSALRDQIQDLLGREQKNVESIEKADVKKTEFMGVLTGSMGIVDLLFDILMGLHEKRINWVRIESYVEKLGDGWSFTGQTLPSLNLDFAKVSAAINRQVPKETPKEVYSILKSIYEYFDGLKPDNEAKDADPSVQIVKAMVLAYYLLNDLLFGRVVGDKNSIEESLELEDVLLSLASESNVKVSFEELMVFVDGFSVEADSERFVEDMRLIFNEQLKQI